MGKTCVEDESGKVGSDAFFVEPAFLDGALVESAWVSRPGKESLAPEDEHEYLHPMMTFGFGESEQALVMPGEIEKRREIDFKELLRDGPGTLVIEPPPCAVGKKTPAEFAGTQIVHAPKIAEHLSRGCVFLAPAAGATVERT